MHTDPTPTATAPTWSVVAESDLTLPDHEAIAAMLAQSFPDWSHWYTGGRSWSGMQPERRILARIDDVVVAHVGIRRMFVTAAGRDQLIGCVGLVGVAPSLQGGGHGRELMARTATLLAELGVPFGLLSTGEETVPFYTRCGWTLLDDIVVHYSAFSADGAGVSMVEDAGWLALPVTATIEEWPAGEVRYNGQQV